MPLWPRVSAPISPGRGFTVAVVDHGQQLLYRVGEQGLLPLQHGAVGRGAVHLPLELAHQLALSVQKLLQLLLLPLEPLELPAVAGLQLGEPLLQETERAG